MDKFFVHVRYQTDYCDSDNSHTFTTNEECLDEIARQALKEHERAFSIELRKNGGNAIHYWTLYSVKALCSVKPLQLTRDNYNSGDWEWYETEIPALPGGSLRPATFNRVSRMNSCRPCCDLEFGERYAKPLTVGNLVDLLSRFDRNLPVLQYANGNNGYLDVSYAEEIKVALNRRNGAWGDGPHVSSKDGTEAVLLA